MIAFLNTAHIRMSGFVTLAVIGTAAASSIVHAAPSVTVAPIDGTASSRVKQEIASAVVTFGNRNGFDASAGEVSIKDAAAAVGCNINDRGCGESVRSTIGVDQLVYGQATGANPVVVRFTIVDSQGVRSANATLAGSNVESDLGPALNSLFNVKTATPTSAPIDIELPELPPKAPPKGPASRGDLPVPSSAAKPPNSPHHALLARGATKAAAKDPPSIELPAAVRQGSSEFSDTAVEPPQNKAKLRRQLAISGLVIGGVATVGGLLLWSKASSIQDDIDAAPIRNINDIRNLQALEERGDSASLWGNVLVVAGVTAVGISGYILYKDRSTAKRTSSASNRFQKTNSEKSVISVYPAVMPHGAAVVVSIGGIQ